MNLLKAFAIAGAGAWIGRWAFEKFVLKQADGSGWVEAKEGIGLDDAIGALVTGAGVVLVGKMLGKALKAGS